MGGIHESDLARGVGFPDVLAHGKLYVNKLSFMEDDATETEWQRREKQRKWRREKHKKKKKT